MGSFITLMHLPAQSGKTRKMTDLINKWNTQIEEQQSSSDMNLIFTSNTKLLVKQCRVRVEKDCENTEDSDDEDVDDAVSEVSLDEIESEMSDTLGLDNDNNKQNIMKEAKTFAWIHEKGHNLETVELASKIKNGTYSNIICCSNNKRMERAIQLLDLLKNEYDEYLYHSKVVSSFENGEQMPRFMYEKSKKELATSYSKRVNIWIDEADASLKFWKKYINCFTGSRYEGLIHNIELISATLSPVYAFLSDRHIKARLRVYKSTHSDSYLRYSDCAIIHTYGYLANNPTDHIQNILDNEEIPSDCRLYCPGLIKRSSHEEISALLQSHGFNVLIINSLNKEIRFELNRKPLSLEKLMDENMELSQVLNSIYHKYGLDKQPFAVTGNICVGRGITFAGEQFMFTHGIIPETRDADEAYQSVARCIGNVLSKECFQLPTIYISEKTHIKVLDAEFKSTNIAKASNYGEDLNDGSTVELSTEALKSFAKSNLQKEKRKKETITDKEHEVFDTQEAAIHYAKTVLGHKLHKRTTDKAPDELLVNGENPTAEELLNRVWGINKKTPVRMAPTNEGKWCVYWRSSLLKTD